MPTEFKLPPLGKNIEVADVGNVLVKVGDTIRKEQAVLEAETEKAAFEVPSTVSGKVQEIKVKAGDRIKVGQVILVIEEGAEAAPKGESKQDQEKPPPQVKEEKKEAKEAGPAEKESPKKVEPEEKSPAKPPVSRSDSSEIYASPLVRRVARELGVDLSQIKGSGPKGRLSVEDVKKALQPAAPPAGALRPNLALPDFSKWGPVRRTHI